MRFSILFALVVCSVDIAVVSADDGGLFSELAMESVFEQPVAGADVAQPISGGTIGRITGVSTLVRVLQAAGFDSKERDGRASFDLQHGGWRFPASIGVQVDRDRLDCELSLIRIADQSLLTTEKLIALLALNDARGAAFAYDRKEKRVLLKATLPNRSITAAELKAGLIQLATVAEKHSDVWQSLHSSDKPESTQTKPPQPQRSLVGRWSASLGGDQAFAIRIASDSTFQLVHLKSGKTTVSKGKVTRNGAQLKLIGDDNVTLNCSVKQTTSDAFQLAINDKKGNVTATLDFKKAK